MSEETAEAMRQWNDAFNRGDKAAWLASMDPEAEMAPAREWPESAPVRGAEAIWDFYVQATNAWEEGSYELVEIIEAGSDRYVVNARREGRGRASGAGVEFSYWVVITYRDGKAFRFEWFAERGEAFEAVGLAE
jgi:ketosteroid isomerase-like protein